MRIHPTADFFPLLWRQPGDGGFDFSDSSHGDKMLAAGGVVKEIMASVRCAFG
jgi:hypothetical protein